MRSESRYLANKSNDLSAASTLSSPRKLAMSSILPAMTGLLQVCPQTLADEFGILRPVFASKYFRDTILIDNEQLVVNYDG